MMFSLRTNLHSYTTKLHLSFICKHSKDWCQAGAPQNSMCLSVQLEEGAHSFAWKQIHPGLT